MDLFSFKQRNIINGVIVIKIKIIENRKKTEKYIKDYLKKHYSKKRRLTPGSVASAILLTIAREARSLHEIMHELGQIDLMPFWGLPSWHSEMGKKKYYSASQLTGGLSNLERGGYIKRREGKRTVFLTDKGIQEILKYKMKNQHLEKPWDGKWRLIVFDIQEATRKDRDYLRRQLKWIGFEELQKSVWIFPYEIRDELKEFIKLCKFEFQGDVRFILADSIEPDVVFRKKFNLI